MAVDQELAKIALDIGALESQFGDTPAGPRLSADGEATFKRLTVEAKSILDSELGRANDFSMNLISAISSVGSMGYFGGASLGIVKAARAQIEGSINHIQRRPILKSATEGGVAPSYVTPSRLLDLRNLPRRSLDPTRLIRLCEELNIAHASECHMATAMLVRGIVDHVAPVFGFKKFEEFANNYGGTASFKGSMLHLQGSLRKIADQHLHTPMRESESLPAAAQVDFRQDLDVLLQEVVRALK
jgi:hypothetical protein